MRQIQRFEESIHVKLFARGDRHVVFIVAGQCYYPVVREVMAGLAQHEKALRQMQHSMSLTVHVYVITSIRWLACRLAEFQSAYPEVELKLKLKKRPDTYLAN